MNEGINKYLTNISLNGPTTKGIIEQAEKSLNVKFPFDYKQFIEAFNGAEGEIGENSYIVFWSVEDIIELNEAYEVNQFAPGLILIGSNGGNTAYAFDIRFESKPIIEVPFIGMDLDEVKLCANTFRGFLEYIYNL